MNNYPTIFNTVVIREDKDKVVLRASVKDEEECKTWIKDYAQRSKTNWIVHYELPDPRRVIMHKKWICHSAKKNKRNKETNRNTECKCKLDIKIKIVSTGSKKNDKYLKQSIPLRSIITIENNHNHDVKLADSLRYLRVTDDTIEKYHGYFLSGMLPPRAIKQHVSILELTGPEILADASVNPRANTVYYIYRKWRKMQSGEPVDQQGSEEQAPEEHATSPVPANDEESSSEAWSEPESIDVDSVIEDLKREVDRLLSLLKNHENCCEILKRLTKFLKTIKTPDDAANAMLKMISAIDSIT